MKIRCLKGLEGLYRVFERFYTWPLHTSASKRCAQQLTMATRGGGCAALHAARPHKYGMWECRCYTGAYLSCRRYHTRDSAQSPQIQADLASDCDVERASDGQVGSQSVNQVQLGPPLLAELARARLRTKYMLVTIFVSLTLCSTPQRKLHRQSASAESCG